MRQLALERLPQVLHLLLVEPQVGVARDAELRVADHLAAREEVAQVLVDDGREEQEGVRSRAEGLGQLHDAREHARRLDDRDRGVAAERVAARELDDEVEALVADLRKRVRRVEPDRRQQRPDLVAEVRGDPRALRGVELAAAQEPHVVLRERGQHVGVQAPVLVVDDAVRFRRDRDVLRAQLGHRRHPGRRPLGAQRLDQAGHADLEELVEVRRDDGEEAQPLEERHRRVLREREDAAVEGDLRQLAVDRRGVVNDVFGGHGERPVGGGSRPAGASRRARTIGLDCDRTMAAASRRGATQLAAASRSRTSQTQRPLVAASRSAR